MGEGKCFPPRIQPWNMHESDIFPILLWFYKECGLREAPSAQWTNLTRDPQHFPTVLEAIGSWVLFTLLDSFFHWVAQTHTSELNVLWEDWEHTPTEQLSVSEIRWVCPHSSACTLGFLLRFRHYKRVVYYKTQGKKDTFNMLTDYFCRETGRAFFILHSKLNLTSCRQWINV